MAQSSTSPESASRGILARVGNTPLIRLEKTVRGLIPAGVRIFAKAEWYNPGGSVKDRAALNMILDGEQRGALTRERVIIDATSGNTGIAYAMIGAALGYRVRLALPANAGAERKRLLSMYGAAVTLTDPLEGTDGAQAVVKRIVGEYRDRYFYPDQYNNPANWQAHYNTTGPEIFRQTAGRITHFIAGLGTTGTFVGTARRLRELNSTIRRIAVQPDAPLHGLEGLKHLESAIVPGIYDPSVATGQMTVSTEEACALTRRLAKEEGLLVGPSGGAALAASIRVAQEITEGIIVTVFPDSGTRYASEHFWETSA